MLACLHVLVAHAISACSMTLLADYLARHEMSQRALARLLRVPSPMVCQWASGDRRPGLANALKIEEATAGAVPARYWTTVRCKPSGVRTGTVARVPSCLRSAPRHRAKRRA